MNNGDTLKGKRLPFAIRQRDYAVQRYRGCVDLYTSIGIGGTSHGGKFNPALSV